MESVRKEKERLTPGRLSNIRAGPKLGRRGQGQVKKEKNYNSKKEDLEEEDQRQDERNVIL